MKLLPKRESVRREGDGDEAKLTVHFQGYGLKKIIQKYAGITTEE